MNPLPFENMQKIIKDDNYFQIIEKSKQKIYSYKKLRKKLQIFFIIQDNFILYSIFFSYILG